MLAYYFPGVENFVLTAPKPVLRGYAVAEPTYWKDQPIEPNAPQGELAIGEAGLLVSPLEAATCFRRVLHP